MMVGLTSTQAAERLLTFGPNQLVTAARWHRVKQLARIVADPMAIMLAGTGALDLILGRRLDAIMMFVALAPVLGVDVILEARSERALARLRAAVAPMAHVLRDGAERSIATSELVPGDVLIVREGDLVFADATVVDGSITVDESHLTGESEPTVRGLDDPIHAGSRIVTGRAHAEITVTGRATAYGKVATLVAAAETGATPLQNRISRMIRRLYTAAVVIASGQLVVDLLLGVPTSTALIAAVTLAMAAAPEEFPLVFTVFLSLGAARLARRGLLVRRLVSVEALGSTTVICVDKTGTLTAGRFALEQHVSLTGDDHRLLETAAFACEPRPDDAMEVAIADHCREHGIDVVELHRAARLVGDHPFEVAGRHMTHVWQAGDHWVVAIKGALEGVLEHCKLTDDERSRALTAMNELAAAGMRVLAVARKDGEGRAPVDRETAERDATLTGLLAFRDPVRREARAAVTACREAGIALKVVTGDHALTARAVAEAVGIEVAYDRVLTGDEIDALPDASRTERIRKATVLARIRPEQKYAIVDALMTSGEVVAMAGDGINDAPALRRASIGISMGERATDVARDAAGIVLLRDDLGAIVETVREGRHIYLNLQRAFLFLVAFHIPLVGLALTTPLVGVPIVLPIHLVWLELVIHPISALVFESEPAPADLMRRPPRPPQQPLLPRAMLVRSLISGSILALSALAIFVWRRGADEEVARTAALAAVLTGGLAVAWVERGLGVPWWRAGIPRTARFWVVALLVAASLPIVLAIPAAAHVMRVAPIGGVDVMAAVLAAFAAIAWRVRPLAV
ncbi:MAG: cation-transporting P-type ATPase [Deltaproteobacteria bacterium]|nr:cation-transporting P-type ATPase [Deltaproteobacteria bacterium]